jgi:hypothetical protein
MADFISTNQIIDPTIQEPFTGPMLNYEQFSTMKQAAGAVAPFIGNNLAVTILSGCGYSYNTGTTTYTIASGSVYYNGEIFPVPAASVTIASGSTVAVGYLNVTDPIGPVIFSDGVPRTVFQSRSIILSAGTSGSGIAGTSLSDFLNWIPLSGATVPITLSPGWSTAIGYPAPIARLDCFGNVSFRATVVGPGGFGTYATTPFQLPTGMKPIYDFLYFPIFTTSASQGANMLIRNSGYVEVFMQDGSPPLSSTTVCVSGSFNINF